MKKLLITLICFCLILCPVLNSGAAFAEEPDPSAELSSEPSSEPSPEPPAEPEPPSQPAEEPAQEPAPSYAPVVITKSPGGETKNEGDTAYFIAHADNAVAIEWLLVSPDGSNMISAKDGPVHFPGLSVDGLYDDTLILANLPVSLNGWRIQARYTGGDGNTVLTDWCSIYVNGVVVPQPIIGLQPTGGSFQVNEDCTLRCNAYSTDNLRVTLQWYSAAESSTASGSPIFGANADSYTVPHTAGTVYYYCEALAFIDNHPSEPLYSNIVAVTYPGQMISAPEPDPTPIIEDAGGVSVIKPVAYSSTEGDASFPVILKAVIAVSALVFLCCVIYLAAAKAKEKNSPVPPAPAAGSADPVPKKKLFRKAAKAAAVPPAEPAADTQKKQD